MLGDETAIAEEHTALQGVEVVVHPLAIAFGVNTILEYYTLVLFWFLGSYYNTLYLKSLYFFLGCTLN